MLEVYVAITCAFPITTSSYITQNLYNASDRWR